MSQTQQHNIGAFGDLVRLTDHSTAVAGGSGDATTVTGNTTDRVGFGSSGMPQSGLMGVIFETTLASGATLSIGYAVQDSADASTWADYQTATSIGAVYATGPSGGGVIKGQANVQVDLTNARRYIRFNYLPDLSAGGTDTFYGDGVGFLGGTPRLPASNL